MAFSSPILTRLCSAVVFGSPVLLAAYIGTPIFELMIALAAAVLAWEWFGLCGNGSPRLIGYTLGVVLLIAVMTAAVFGFWQAVAALILGAAIVLLVSGGLLIWLRGDGSFGRDVVFWLIVVVWAADTGAYIAGRMIGGPRLAPRISPNKTWAGLAGGVGFAAATSVGFAGASGQSHLFAPAVVGAIMGFTAQAGDLAESWVKRRFGVKDASALIPGHGGLLDRVDGLLLVILVVALIAAADEGALFRWL